MRSLPGPGEVGKPAARARIEEQLGTFSSISLKVHQTLAEGDTVATRWTWRGTLRSNRATLRMDGTTFHVVRDDVVAASFDTWATVEPDDGDRR